MSLFANDIILHIEKSQRIHTHIPKLLELINDLSKVSGYKINAQKSVLFVYTSNEQSEKEIKKIIPFTITSKRIKYPGISKYPWRQKTCTLKTRKYC